MSLSRRSLFGLFAGAAAAPVLPKPLVFDEPTVRYTYREYGLGTTITKADFEAAAEYTYDLLHEAIGRSERSMAETIMRGQA